MEFVWRGVGGTPSAQTGLTPNRENAALRRDLRNDDWCNLVGDNGLGFVVVDADRVERAHSAVGHPVGVDVVKRRRYINRLWGSAGSCTHAPQAAANDITVGLRDREKKRQQGGLRGSKETLRMSNM